jgi:uncharacterized protein (TIGR02099 family)
MSPRLHRHLHIARRTLWHGLVAAVVLMALVFGIASQLLPLAERHPDRIAAFLGERVHRPVAFDRVETQWTRRGPLLRLDNLRLGSGAETLRVGDAEMLVSQYAGLLPGRSFTELRLRGLDLTLERDAGGRWQVRGLPGETTAGSDPFAQLEGLGELQVIGGRLAIHAPSLGIDAQVPRVDLRLRVDGDRVRIGARAWIRDGVAPVQAALDFDRVAGDGRGHMIARDADLGAWSPLLRFAGAAVEAGTGQVEAWMRLRAHRVSEVQVDGAFERVGLRGAPFPVAQASVAGTVAMAGNAAVAGTAVVAPAPRVRLRALALRARWQAVAGGWRLDASRLRIDDGAARVLDGLSVGGGQRQGLRARRLDVGPLLQVAALGNRLPTALRRWFVDAAPRGTASNLLVASKGNALRVSARLDDVGFAPVGHAPGFTGMAGDLVGDEAGFAMRFDPRAPFRFDWPAGFGVPHPARLEGAIAGWREGAGWRFGTGALRVRGSDFGANVRGGMWFQADGTRPWIDLAADLDTTALPAAKGFWIHHMMPAAAIHWLDGALVGGRLEDAHAIVSGDLDDWPFRGTPGDPARGLFQVAARLADATLKFQPDWPAATHVEGDIAFVADGFHVSGKGVLAGVGIRHFDAGIERFGHAPLLVTAQGGGDASRLLALLRDSPLHREYGETLDNLSVGGLASVTFGLDLPLHRDEGGAKIDGTVALAGVRMEEKRWKLAFENARGRAHYGSGGFAAERLAVRHDGAPARLSLRAGDETRDPRQAFEAALEGNLAADRLLQRVPELGWLQGRASGRSDWVALLTIPRGNAPVRPTAARPGASRSPATGPSPPAHLQLRSNLAGTALDLPAPLAKPAAAVLAATIDTTLPIGDGEVSVVLGRRLALRARSAAPAGVRVVLGSDTVADPPPASGLIVTGRTDALDALEWVAVARGGDKTRPAQPRGAQPRGTTAGGDGDGLALRRMDVTAARLNLLGASFPDTRLQLSRAGDAIAVQLQGDAISGSVRVPDAEGATVAGRFDRVRWPLPAPADATKGAPPPAPADDGDATDPAAVPPLSFDIADLRVGDAALGETTLRTQPVAGGLRIARLHAQAPKQAIDATGEWLGRGTAARTHVAITVDSNDFGKLLAGIGYGGQLAEGKGRTILDARWPGSPGDFAAPVLEGTLSLDVADGRLTELEPGAGRVLGLLGVAQLPRRLTLDFRDFFDKGFAFDRLHGLVRVSGGKASTDDLAIAGPAAQISIRGTTDLRAQTFDQSIEVVPRAGNLLTAVGAIAGGPVGAAIGAAANAVLRKPLGQLAAKSYRVTGPWKEPKVEVVSREAAPAVPPAPAPAPPSNGPAPAPSTDTMTMPPPG